MSESKAKRSRIEALRAEQAKQRAAAARRRQMLMIGVPVVVVVLAVVVMVVVKANQGKTKDKGPSVASAQTVSQLTSLQPATLDAAGASGKNALIPVSGQAPLASGGKPEVLYIGAEYCPYCAAERWPTIVALSRFGTFSGLQEAHSSSSDVYASTPTWTFRKASYTSQYIAFTGVETQDVNEKPLQSPTSEQQALLQKLDGPPYVQGQAGSIPFIDFGNQYIISGASYDPGVLKGLTQAKIAADLANPQSGVAKAVLPVANQITAAICKIINNRDVTVCTDPVITKAEGTLGAKS